MPSSQKGIVHCVSAGDPPKKMLKDVETIKFVIYDFKYKQEKRGEYIKSPNVNAHGYEWCIKVYPRGSETFSTDDNHISPFLELRVRNDVTATCVFRCKGFKARRSQPHRFQIRSWGKPYFLGRDNVIKNYLEEDGSLVIECDIRIAVENKRIWYPKELQRQDLLVELYQNASSETSDAIFFVGETLFRVHKSILSLRGKKLFEIANDSDNDVPIPMHSASAEIFKSILDFVYTVKAPKIENENTATELLVAADCYDCVHLKLYIESVLVDKFLKPENAAAMLIFADSHSCALLKEAATNLFVTDAETVRNAKAWSKIKESNRLLVELLDSLVLSNKLVGINCNRTGETDRLDVTALREELGNANLELDGSREVLIERLHSHHQRQRQNKGQDTEK